MQVIVCESPEESAQLVASEILRELGQKPDLVLGLATGSTPVGVYRLLVEAHREGVDFSHVRTFNLDEYLGIPADHPQSYRSFMNRHLFDGINVAPENIHFPPTDQELGGDGANELPRRFEEHEALIRELGGIDIQLLGIGSNGHIGFNEPTSSLASRTRIKTLTDKTLADNARFYGPDEKQPRLAVTLGIATILDARRIFLQAFGAKKAEAIKQCVEGPISSYWPATILQTHRRVTAFVDEESGARLEMLDYYRRARAEEKRLIEEGLWP